MKLAGYSIKALLHLFFPENCMACGGPLAEGERMLCLGCNIGLPRTGFHHLQDNPASSKFTGRIPAEAATAFLYFTKEGMVQELVHRVKYAGQQRLGRFLGYLFALDLMPAGWLSSVDIIIPVPLHFKKERQRGYNQAACIAEGLGRASGITVLNDALCKTRHTESQTHKSVAARIENVQDAYALKKAELLAGKHLLLIDDVLTTGATLESCARTLLQAPGTRISLAVLAMTAD